MRGVQGKPKALVFCTPGKTAWCEVGTLFKLNESQSTIIQSVYQVFCNNSNWDGPRHTAARISDNCKRIATGA